ncbi:MAG: FecR domain-containing protein [Bacteroidales bacterium]|nr:FecR domain-containing protein [Bacteroidales bacterium]
MEANLNNEYWDLIAKYLANECDKDEIDNLFNWINESEENKILFNQVKQDLKIINIDKSMNKINVDSAWEKLKDRIEEDEQALPIIEERKSRRLHAPFVLKYAAAIILLVSVGFFTTKYYMSLQDDYRNITEITAKNEIIEQITLPDGSIVSLNADSKLEYPEEFTDNERKVKLTGEGFFDVTKNPEKPFIIEAENAEVRVLGTSFNVNTRLSKDNVEVFVKTGLVELKRKNNGDEKLLIKPGNVGVLTKSKLEKSVNTNNNIIAWKTREIIFREDKMSDVIHILNTVYNTSIICENQEVLNLKYTSTFANQDINSVLNVICVTFDLKVEYKNDKIYLIKLDS